MANSARKIAANASTGAAHLADGYLIVPELGTVGGIEYDQQVTHDEGESRLSKHIKYDHPDLQKLANKAINRAYHLLRTHCAPAFGATYFCRREDFDTLDRDFQDARDVATSANDIARRLKSGRKTRAEIFPLPADKNNPRLALRVGQSIYTRLVNLREAYTSEDRNAYQMEMRECKNLFTMVTGEQREIIRNALASAEAQRPIMLALIGGERSVQKVVKARGKLPDLDYRPIDTAIDLFAPAADAFL